VFSSTWNELSLSTVFENISAIDSGDMEHRQQVKRETSVTDWSYVSPDPLEMIMFGHSIRTEDEELQRFLSGRIFLVQKPLESPGDGTKADLQSVPVSDAASGDRSAPTDVNQSWSSNLIRRQTDGRGNHKAGRMMRHSDRFRRLPTRSTCYWWNDDQSQKLVEGIENQCIYNKLQYNRVICFFFTFIFLCTIVLRNQKM
jgi:hypothetical protein